LDKVPKKWQQEKWASAVTTKSFPISSLSNFLPINLQLSVGFRPRIPYSLPSILRGLDELGPSPTLTGIAIRTAKTRYEALDGSVSRNHSILCHAKNVKEIYYQYEDEALASVVTADVLITATPAAPVVRLFPHHQEKGVWT
jgi:fatty acid synthase subunit beta